MEQVCVLEKGATMKKEIQPNYVEVKFVCACGTEFAGKNFKTRMYESIYMQLLIILRSRQRRFQ